MTGISHRLAPCHFETRSAAGTNQVSQENQPSNDRIDSEWRLRPVIRPGVAPSGSGVGDAPTSAPRRRVPHARLKTRAGGTMSRIPGLDFFLEAAFFVRTPPDPPGGRSLAIRSRPDRRPPTRPRPARNEPDAAPGPGAERTRDTTPAGRETNRTPPAGCHGLGQCSSSTGTGAKRTERPPRAGCPGFGVEPVWSSPPGTGSKPNPWHPTPLTMMGVDERRS